MAADAATSLDIDHGAGTIALTTEDIQQLPDDPDDLLQQLQLLASTGGGASGAATVVVNGFQNGSAMPPKSSIASIRVNPDSRCAGVRTRQFRRRPDRNYDQARHRAPARSTVFLQTATAPSMPTDPFSVPATPAGKRRYGFELGGPLIAKKSGFALALEKRDIDEFDVVNAITLDANLNQVPEQATVAAPQRLWIASARGDWQATQKDIATLSYSANMNNRGNQGAGGQTIEGCGLLQPGRRVRSALHQFLRAERQSAP